MIPKEKLKVGSLYKTKNVSSEVIAYRVWLGTGWSMGAHDRRKKSYVLYKQPWAPYEKAITINKIGSPFLPETAPNVDLPYATFTPLYKSQPKKPIRYLNRPEQV